MASERYLRLAQLLADGVDGVEACLAAGWPIENARWLGPVAFEHLAKAGIEIPAPGETVTDNEPAESVAETQDEPVALDEPSADEDSEPAESVAEEDDPPSADAGGEAADDDEPAGTTPAPRRKAPARRRTKRVAK